MKRKDWTGGLFFIYLAFVIWVILLKFSTSPDALPHLRNINLIPYGDCLMVNGNLNIRELAENILIFVPFGIYGGMLARERAGGNSDPRRGRIQSVFRNTAIFACYGSK